jgi:uncharacterized membrane protein YhaH (DUF805 family)
MMDYILNFDWKNADWQYLMTKPDGRINRYPFLMGILALFIVNIALSIIGLLIGWVPGVGFLLGLVNLAMLFPSFILSTKRWHDRGKSGWWNLVVLIPLLGLIYMIYELCFQEGEPGTNQYGPNPLITGAISA